MSPVYCYIPRCELQVSVDVYWWRCVLMEMCVCVCSSVSCVAVTTMKHSCCSVICVTVAITRTASRSRVSSYVWARVLHWLFDDYWCVGCIPVALMSSVCHVGCKCCFFGTAQAWQHSRWWLVLLRVHIQGTHTACFLMTVSVSVHFVYLSAACLVLLQVKHGQHATVLHPALSPTFFSYTWSQPFTFLDQSNWKTTRMWANAQPDGRPAEHRWRPLFNAAKFGWRPLLDAVQ